MLVYTPFMLRKLGQAEYGLFSLVNTTIAYLTILDFGFGNAIVRYTAKYRVEQDKAKEETLHGMFLVLYLVIGILAFGLSLLLILNINRLFSSSLSVEELATAKKLMWLAAINLTMTFPFSVYAAIITAHERFIFSRFVNILRLVLNPLMMVLVLVFGYRSIGMIAATTALNLLFNIVNLVYCKRILNVKLRFKGFDLVLLKEIGLYSFYVFLNIIVDRIYWSSGQFLLGIYIGTIAVSIYSVSMLFVNMLYMNISSATSGLFMTKITQINIKDSAKEDLNDLFIKVGRIQFIILALVLSGFCLYGKQFIALWAGCKYLESYTIAVVMMVPLTIPLIQNLGIAILQSKNLHAFRSVSCLAIAIFNVAISIPMIKLWGTVGCAIGTAFSLIVGNVIVMNYYYCRRLGLDIASFWREIAKIIPGLILPCLLSVFFLRFYSADLLSGLIVHMFLYTLIYCLSMFFIGLNVFEKNLVLDPLRKFFDSYKFRGSLNDPH